MSAWESAGLGELPPDLNPSKAVLATFDPEEAEGAIEDAIVFSKVYGYNDELRSDEQLTADQALDKIGAFLTPAAQTKARGLFNELARLRDLCSEVGTGSRECSDALNGRGSGSEFSVEEQLDARTFLAAFEFLPNETSHAGFRWKVLKAEPYKRGGRVAGISVGLKSSTLGTGEVEYKGKTYPFDTEDGRMFRIHWMHMVPNQAADRPAAPRWLVDDFTMGFPDLTDGRVARPWPPAVVEQW